MAKDLESIVNNYKFSSLDHLVHARAKVEIDALQGESVQLDDKYFIRLLPQQPVPKRLKHKIDRIK